MRPHADDQFAIRRVNAQQGHGDTRERILAVPEGFGTSLYQPDTPRTTISAVLKNCAAPGEDFTVPVPQIHANSEPQIKRKKLCLFSFPTPDGKQESAIKRVLKNFSSGRKRSKPNATERSSNASSEGRRSLTLDICRWEEEEDFDFNTRFSDMLETSSHTATHPSDYRGIPQAHHPQACSSLSPRDRLSPTGSTAASHGIILGSQVPHSGYNRLPPTYNLTPTNADSYAVSGRSRLVSGRFVSSHHADIQGAEAASSVHASKTPTIDPRPTAPDSLTPQSACQIVPRPILVVDSTPIPTQSDDTQQPVVEMRRSVSVPANLTTKSTSEFIRTSAVPPPLRVRGEHHVQQQQQQQLKHTASQDTDTATATEQLTRRFDKLEHKLDRALDLLLTLTGLSSTSHTATPRPRTPPTQSTPTPHKPRRRRERTRSIRANLTGLPPHIPYGGSQGGGADLQGWYDAVTAEDDDARE